MDALYKLFDRFSEMIPPQLLPVIRLAAILVWVVLAGIVAVLAWGQGSESAPQMGQELSLAEIKARQQREANLKKPQSVRIPDLNELIPERSREPIQYESPTLDARRQDSNANTNRMLESDGELIEPRNPVSDPRGNYRGEGLAPRDGQATPGMLPVGPQDYRPARDAGVGGVRDDAGGSTVGNPGSRSDLELDDSNLRPLDPGIGLDGRPLNRSRPPESREQAQPAPTQSSGDVPAQRDTNRESSRPAAGSSGDLPLLD